MSVHPARRSYDVAVGLALRRWGFSPTLVEREQLSAASMYTNGSSAADAAALVADLRIAAYNKRRA